MRVCVCSKGCVEVLIFGYHYFRIVSFALFNRENLRFYFLKIVVQNKKSTSVLVIILLIFLFMMFSSCIYHGNICNKGVVRNTVNRLKSRKIQSKIWVNIVDRSALYAEMYRMYIIRFSFGLSLNFWFYKISQNGN